jgi:ABC-type uncharacterized transport system permease subunit
MTRLLKLYLHFLKLAWMRSLEYRVNFMTWMVVDTGWSFLDMIFFSALINFTQVIGTWNRGQALVVIGVFRLLVIPVWGWMFSSFSKIPRLISEGKLDLLLGKPVDNQFLVSVQDFSFSILPSLVTGSVFTVYGLYLLRIVPSFSAPSPCPCILTAWTIFTIFFLPFTMSGNTLPVYIRFSCKEFLRPFSPCL